MTKLPPSVSMNKAIQQLLHDGTDAEDLVGELLRRGSAAILQEGLEGEVTEFLGRDRYERREEDMPSGYRNGYRKRHLKTTGGTITVQEPRTRDTDVPFESALLGRVERIEERLKAMALEMYARGLSTRDIEQTLVDESGAPLLSRATISRMTEELYAEYEAFAKRDLSELDVVYLFLDGVYESVRRYTGNQAILCAWGILSNGTKTMIHLEAVSSESRDAWEAFLEGLLGRGMPHPLVVITDGGGGLKAALARCLPHSDRQRCLAHKMRNLCARMPLVAKPQLKAEIQTIYYASDEETARLLAERFVDAHADTYPSVVKCFNDDLDACLTQLKYPRAHRRFIRTTNLIERAFVEEKRRTKVIPQHVNERGAVKLVFAALIRASNSWRGVAMTELELAQLRTLRAVMWPDKPYSDTISYRIAA